MGKGNASKHRRADAIISCLSKIPNDLRDLEHREHAVTLGEQNIEARQQGLTNLERALQRQSEQLWAHTKDLLQWRIWGYDMSNARAAAQKRFTYNSPVDQNMDAHRLRVAKERNLGQLEPVELPANPPSPPEEGAEDDDGWILLSLKACDEAKAYEEPEEYEEDAGWVLIP